MGFLELGLVLLWVGVSAQAHCSPAKRIGHRNTRLSRGYMKIEHISSQRGGDATHAGTTGSARAVYGLVIARAGDVGPQLTVDPRYCPGFKSVG